MKWCVRFQTVTFKPLAEQGRQTYPYLRTDKLENLVRKLFCKR